MKTQYPHLYKLHSPDVYDLTTHKTDDDSPFCFLVQAFFLWDERESGESFDFLVCNPMWISESEREVIMSGNNHIILKFYNYNILENFIKKQTLFCGGRDWEEAANKIHNRLGRWEFYDYVDEVSPK
jgi:Immunity protein 8